MAATRDFIMPVSIAFGDCDPAGIVYFPNFFRWFDAGMHEMFASVGLPADKVTRETGLVVWPSIDTKATFHAPARYGEQVEVRIGTNGELALKTLDLRVSRLYRPDVVHDERVE